MNKEIKLYSSNYIQEYKAVDSHTLGQFTRVVVDGFPHIEGKTMIEKKKYLEDHCDDIRTSLMLEPRGHADMFGSVLMEPVHDECDFGVVYMDTGEYLNMCGHGTMGTATVCVEAGLVPMVKPYTYVNLDAPAGIIRTKLKIEDEKAVEVTITNVPSFVYQENVRLDIDGKDVVIDIIFAGNFFALVDASQFDWEIGAKNVSKFSKIGMQILRKVATDLKVKHPLIDITVVDHCEFYVKSDHEGADICNTVIFGEGQCDRSPCGTGTSSMLVKLHHMGKLKVGESIVTESVIGSHFTGRIKEETMVGDFKAIVPEITGAAYITGVSTYLIDKRDPLKKGFLLG
ncbi:MAG: proline racemase family protein [Erysipelotrichaceae bacterium]